MPASKYNLSSTITHIINSDFELHKDSRKSGHQEKAAKRRLHIATARTAPRNNNGEESIHEKDEGQVHDAKV